MNFITKVGAMLTLLAALAACQNLDAGGTIGKAPAALSGDYSGKDYSGAVAWIPDAYDIPGVPESVGKKPRWSELERKQALHLDAHCQKELFEQLPDWAQAIVKEAGWGALATAVGQAGFAAAFPGADLVRYFLGGLGYGAASWANNGRVRQDQGEKGTQGFCVVLKTFRAQQKYGILPGFDAIPWYGPGHTKMPKAKDDETAPNVSSVQSENLPPLPFR